MITHGDMSDIIYYNRIRELGLREEEFLSLPSEYQKAILMSGYDTFKDHKKKNEFRKKMALMQYDLEEKVKVKVLSLFKKNK